MNKSFLIMKGSKIIAIFLRRWEAEKFIEMSKSHGYKLVIE